MFSTILLHCLSDEYFANSIMFLILDLVACSANHFKNEFFIRCLNCYSNIPVHFANANSVLNFKKLLNLTDLSTYDIRSGYDIVTIFSFTLLYHFWPA